MRSLLSCAAICLLFTAGCTMTAESEPVDLDAARASLVAVDESFAAAYAASTSPADVFADHVTESASLLPPGAPITEGKGAIRQAIANLEAMPGFAVSWGPTRAEVSADGGLGYTIGNYSMQMDGPDGAPILIDGKYLTVWRRQADGGWKIEADMFNPDGEPTAVEEPAADDG